MSSENHLLRLVQALPTSGARAVEAFSHSGVHYLAVAQMAKDIAGQPAKMNGGDSDVETQIYRWADGRFELHQSLKVPGGEDAEFFWIGRRAFLATASIREGAGKYEFNVDSKIFEFIHGRFEEFQRIPTFAAKQWRHFTIGSRHFLALAQGVVMDGVVATNPSKSCIFEWDGALFLPFQEVRSAWGYNWECIEVDGQTLLGYADHAERSILLRWDGSAFQPFQEMDGSSGRAFCCFRHSGETWLAFANLLGESLVYRWSNGSFRRDQALSGPGGREFTWFTTDRAGYLVQVNFLHGSRESPLTELESVIYRCQRGTFSAIETFPTLGGTDTDAFKIGAHQYLAVANSLTADIRFRADSHIYRITD
jgi:hypothetical protein